MSRARLSIIVYGIYLASAGVVLAFAPNLLFSLAGIPETKEPWIRLAGCLAMVLAIKGIQNSKQEIPELFQMDVYTRAFAGTFIAVLALTGIAPRILLLLSAVDWGGALWTQLALRADKKG